MSNLIKSMKETLALYAEGKATKEDLKLLDKRFWDVDANSEEDEFYHFISSNGYKDILYGKIVKSFEDEYCSSYEQELTSEEVKEVVANLIK